MLTVNIFLAKLDEESKPGTATHCNMLQHTATHCNIHNLAKRIVDYRVLAIFDGESKHAAIHCITLQQLQHVATHCR